jgi:hypothetical protein
MDVLYSSLQSIMKWRIKAYAVGCAHDYFLTEINNGGYNRNISGYAYC